MPDALLARRATGEDEGRGVCDHLHDVKVVHYCPTRYAQARVLDRSVGCCADRRAEGVHGEYEAHVRVLDARHQYYCTAARRAYLVVPEIGVLKWFLGSSSIASVNLGSESRF